MKAFHEKENLNLRNLILRTIRIFYSIMSFLSVVLIHFYGITVSRLSLVEILNQRSQTPDPGPFLPSPLYPALDIILSRLQVIFMV